MLTNAAQAGFLRFHSQEQQKGPERNDHEAEPLIQAKVRHVTFDPAQVFDAGGLAARDVQHRRRRVEARNARARSSNRDRDPAGATAQLEHGQTSSG